MAYMDYLRWNDSIGSRFFNTDRSGARVFLYVTREVISEVGAQSNANLDDFVAAVKDGPPWNTRHGWSICQQALQALHDWRERHLVYPPYLAYLALFTLADTIEVDGFSRASYYPGLRDILGEEPAAGTYPSFDQMYELWFDLEQWSNEDKNGELGIFYADILGSREYVGLPKAQTILTDDERHKLPLLFAENGVDPFSPPSDRELSYLLAHEIHHNLLPKTKRLLNDRGSEARAVLLDTIYEELEDWDGTVPPHAEQGSTINNSLGNLRLAMTHDGTAKTVQVFLRCRSGHEYPEEGLQFLREGEAEPLYCYEDWQGWSSPLYQTEIQMSIFDASQLDWRGGLSLTDREHAWKASLSKRSVRVMVAASVFGFDGFVEENQIPLDKPFYLLAYNEHSEVLRKWGRDYCTGFSTEEVVSGLPRNWVLFSVERAHEDVGINDALPFLAFPKMLRIRALGGLKIRGNKYFAFALPQIQITGATGDDKVYCNDSLLQANSETGLFNIQNDVYVWRYGPMQDL